MRFLFLSSREMFLFICPSIQTKQTKGFAKIYVYILKLHVEEIS